MAKTVIRLNEDELKGMIKNILKENIENGNGVLLAVWQADSKEKHLQLLIWQDKV